MEKISDHQWSLYLDLSVLIYISINDVLSLVSIIWTLAHCDRQNNGPTGMSALILRTRDCVTLHDKTDFAAMIKVIGFELGRLSWVIQVDPI